MLQGQFGDAGHYDVVKLAHTRTNVAFNMTLAGFRQNALASWLSMLNVNSVTTANQSFGFIMVSGVQFNFSNPALKVHIMSMVSNMTLVPMAYDMSLFLIFRTVQLLVLILGKTISSFHTLALELAILIHSRHIHLLAQYNIVLTKNGTTSRGQTIKR